MQLSSTHYFSTFYFYGIRKVGPYYSKPTSSNSASKLLLYPANQANVILPTIPIPSFRIHVNAAAKGVAAVSPTPTPLMIACVVRVPVMVLQNACKNKEFCSGSSTNNNSFIHTSPTEAIHENITHRRAIQAACKCMVVEPT